MNTREKILQWAKVHDTLRTLDLVKELKISRQTLVSHLSALVAEGKLEKSGSTRNSVYKLSNRKPVKNVTLRLVKSTKNLEEHLVFEEAEKRLNLKSLLSPKAFIAFQYSFTEMLNNAIDHSKSPKVNILIEILQKTIRFEIKDLGIGVFHNVQKQFKLKNEFEGMEHVFKGKQTTLPAKHSGEGIFFTSRIADLFALKSHQLLATVDNVSDETYAKEDKFEKGTKVLFHLNKNSRKSLAELFKNYTDEDYNFVNNQVRVTLSKDSGNLSRSQAKRLLFGLDKFKKIIFDFKGIKEIGQGFADEIFRIYALSHPDIQLEYDNAVPVVEFMIKRTKK